METDIKNRLNDITYKSELTQPFLNSLAMYFRKGWVNSHNNLLTLRVRKLCAH
jgi:hypothetical protein